MIRFRIHLNNYSTSDISPFYYVLILMIFTLDTCHSVHYNHYGATICLAVVRAGIR